MTIHTTDPFATPDDQRSPVRRFRGRLPSPVTLWTARTSGVPAGLTVSSVLVVDGAPGRIVGIIDDESDLCTAIRASERFTVISLGTPDRQLADRFAGLLPAPGGLFRDGEWTETPYGPVPSGGYAWAGCALDTARPYGWGLLVEAVIERVELGTRDAPVLAHVRGRYHEVTG